MVIVLILVIVMMAGVSIMIGFKKLEAERRYS